MQWRRQCSLHSKRFREVGKQRKTKEGVLPARKMGLEPKMKEGELGRGWKFAMIAFGPASTLVIFYTMVTDRFQPPLLSIRWERVAFFFCFVPLLSLVSCVSIALVWHFDETTKTHCNVLNFLPSISAVIGGEMPEKFIWRTTMAVHCFSRIVLFSTVIHKYYKNTQLGRQYSLTSRLFGPLNLLNCVSHVVENVALMTLSYVSSTDNLAVHEGSFIIFTVSAMLYMFLSCILFWLTANKPMSTEHYKLLRRKVFIMFFNYCSFGLSMYFFFRHEWYCEPGMYTLFALAEYCTILSNIAFMWHLLSLFDGSTLSLAFTDNNASKMN